MTEPQTWTKQDILDAIPHRPPFLFVDEIHSWTDESILTSYRFKPEEFFFPGHYPNTPIVPGVILCESAMQAGAVFLSRLFQQEDQKRLEELRKNGRPDSELKKLVPVVGRMNEIKFKRIVTPGETVQQEITFKEKMGSAYFLSAKVTVNGALAVKFEFACTRTEQ